MADPEHLELLIAGVAEWNQWRREHPDVRPDLAAAQFEWVDLSGADLHDADLTGADLCECELSGADLRQACLVDAYLRETVLRGANLAAANLTDSELRDANFAGANLTGAVLRGASMTETSLAAADASGADLSGVDLTRGDLTDAVLRSANLRGANLRCESVAGVDVTGADLRGIILEKDHRGRFANVTLELLQATGIGQAKFTDPETYAWHAENAFRFVHDQQTDAVKPDSRRQALSEIDVLEEVWRPTSARTPALDRLANSEALRRKYTRLTDFAATLSRDGWKTGFAHADRDRQTLLVGITHSDPMESWMLAILGTDDRRWTFVQGVYRLVTSSPAPHPVLVSAALHGDRKAQACRHDFSAEEYPALMVWIYNSSAWRRS